MAEEFYVAKTESEARENAGSDVAADLAAAASTLWEKCYKQRICIKTPFGKKCTPWVKACVRIIKLAGKFYVEFELDGRRWTRPLVDSKFKVSYGIATLELAITNVVLVGGSLKSATLRVDLCIGKWGLNKCWKVYEGKITFLHMTAEAASEYGLGEEDLQYAYLDDDEVKDECDCEA